MAACAHGDSYAIAPQGSDRPFVPAEPARLTYSNSADRDASWLGDGSGILYTNRRPDHAGDYCLGIIPATGGQGRRTICHAGPHQADSLDALEAAAMSPLGRLVYLHSSRAENARDWYPRQLVLADSADPTTGRTLTRVPAFGVRTHTGLSQTHWLDERHLVYRADDWQFQTGVSIGLFVMHVDVDAEPAIFTVVPGTDAATGVAVQDPDAIIYSLASDSRVYRRVLSTGSVQVLWDFGPGVEARDVQIAGPRLVAVLGAGAEAGVIAVVDLDAGSSRILDTGLDRYKHVALSPSGHALVAESAAIPTDLYLFTLPD